MLIRLKKWVKLRKRDFQAERYERHTTINMINNNQTPKSSCTCSIEQEIIFCLNRKLSTDLLVRLAFGMVKTFGCRNCFLQKICNEQDVFTLQTLWLSLKVGWKPPLQYKSRRTLHLSCQQRLLILSLLSTWHNCHVTAQVLSYPSEASQ